MREDVEIERGEDIGHAQGTGGVAAPSREQHLDDGLADRVCFRDESSYL